MDAQLHAWRITSVYHIGFSHTGQRCMHTLRNDCGVKNVDQNKAKRLFANDNYRSSCMQSQCFADWGERLPQRPKRILCKNKTCHE